MTTISPVLACGSMSFGAGVDALISSVVCGWLVSCILVVVNLCLITFLRASTRFKVTNVGVFSVYGICAFALFAGWFGDVFSPAIFFPVFGIPVLVISHFAYLLWTRRRLRLQSFDTTK